ncbi:MAG: hypothetical protein HY553_07915, partial [Elusimicrobia bacterium]|nr:hypothetical protein [Elusimicrobiota bacterium]
VHKAQLAIGAVETDRLASGAITANKLGALAVQTGHLDNLAVTGAKVAALTLDSSKLGALSIDSEKLSLGAVHKAQLAIGAVETDRLASGAVTANKLGALAVQTGHLDNLAVTGAKVAALTLDSTKLGALSVDSEKLALGAVQKAQLAIGAVETDRLASGAVTANTLFDGAVQTSKLDTDSVTALKLRTDAASLAKVSGGSLWTDGTNVAVGATAVSANTLAEVNGNLKATRIGLGQDPDNAFSLRAVGAIRGPKLTGDEIESPNSGATGNIRLKLNSPSGQTADLMQWLVNDELLGVVKASGQFGIGTAAPASSMTVAGTLGFTEMLAADSPVSAAKTARLYMDAATSRLRLSQDGSAYGDILFGTIDSTKLGALSVDSEKIVLGAVGKGQLAIGAVETDRIGSGAVTANKLFDAAVQTNKLATDSVSSTKLLSDSASLARVSGGAMLVSGSKIGIGGTPDTAKLHLQIPSGSANGTGLWAGPSIGDFPSPGYLGMHNAWSKDGVPGANGISPTLSVYGMNNQATFVQIGVAATAESNHASGSLTDLAGLWGESYSNGAATIDKAYSVGGQSFHYGAGVTTDMSTVRAFTNSRTAGTVTNNHGLYLDDQSGVANVAANNYQIYSAGASPFVVRSDGNVGVGTNAPARQLHLAGSSGIRLAASALPGTPAAGDIAIDSGDGTTLKWHDGSGWREAGVRALSIDSTKLGALSVDSEKIVLGAVGKGQLAIGAVETDRLASGAVNTNKIAMGAVQTDKLNADAVTGAKLLRDETGLAKVSGGAMTATGGEIAVDSPAGAPNFVLQRAGVTKWRMTVFGSEEFYLRDTSNNFVISAAQGGKVGINTDFPDTTLDVNGAVTVRGLGSAPAASPADQARLYFDTGTDRLYLSENTGSYQALVTGTIDSTKLGALSVDSEKLVLGAVGKGQLAIGAVETDRLASGAVTVNKLHSNAASLEKVSGGAMQSDGSTVGIGIAAGTAKLTVNRTGVAANDRFFALQGDGSDLFKAYRASDGSTDVLAIGGLHLTSTREIASGADDIKINPGTTGNPPLTVFPEGANPQVQIQAQSVTQTGPLLQLKDKDGKVLSTFDLTGRLGIGTNSAISSMTVAGTLGFTEMLAADAPVSAAKTARIYMDAATSRLRLSQDGSAFGDLLFGTVDSAKLGALSVDSEKLVLGAVQKGQLAIGAVETDRLASGAVTANKIFDAAVQTSKLAADSVNSSSLLPDSGGLRRVTGGVLEISGGNVSGFSQTVTFTNGIYTFADRLYQTSGCTGCNAVEFLPNGVSGGTRSGILLGPTFNAANADNYASLRLTPTVGGSAFTQPDHRGIHIADTTLTGGASLTTNYGLYIDNQTAGGTNYSLYSAGGQSYFAGRVGLGATVPSYKLSIGNGANETIGIEDAGATTNAGKTLTVRAAAGGTDTTGGAGGDLVLVAGTANGTAANAGGKVTLTPGAPSSTGATGFVEIAGGAAGAHLRATQTTDPTVGTPSTCGTAPTASVTAGSTDLAGSVTIDPDADVGGGTCDTVVTFNKAYAATPKAVILTPSDSTALTDCAPVAVTAKSASSFTITCQSASSGTARKIDYIVIE